jgi:hypothetical protein
MIRRSKEGGNNLQSTSKKRHNELTAKDYSAKEIAI